MAVCTNCKAENPAESMFCLECGTAVSEPRETPTVRTSGKRSTRIVLIVVLLVVGLGGGVMLTLSGVLEPLTGKRFTQAELDEEKDASFDLGKKAGFSAGYSSGDSDGYTRGYAAGCDHVFDVAGHDQVIGIYYPFRTYNLGRYYWTRSETC
jgi:hypothetical protein